jgi:hypothetical protein
MMIFEASDEARLDYEEAKWVGHPAGTPLKDLPADALRFLAIRYFDERRTELIDAVYRGSFMGDLWWRFTGLCLEALARVMGKEPFDAVAAETGAAVKRKCAEAYAEERALPPCLTCGRSRALSEEFWGEGTGLCAVCFSKMKKPEHEHPIGLGRPSVESKILLAWVKEGDLPSHDDDLPF